MCRSISCSCWDEPDKKPPDKANALIMSCTLQQEKFKPMVGIKWGCGHIIYIYIFIDYLGSE